MFALREQIQSETRTAAVGAERKGEQLILLLDDLARSGCPSIEAMRLLPQLKRSIIDFYNPALNRGWTWHFAVKDITSFAELCCPEANPPAPPIKPADHPDPTA